MNKEKKILIMQLMIEIDEPLLKFFNINSDRMLDKKIKVLTELKEGKTISEIPEFYDVLELYPQDGVMWD